MSTQTPQADAVAQKLPAPECYRYWSHGHRNRWIYAKAGAQPPGAEALYTEEQMRAALTPPKQVPAEALERDAMRYRWLRRKVCVIGDEPPAAEFHFLNLVSAPNDWRLRSSAESLDAAIDAALPQPPQGAEGEALPNVPKGWMLCTADFSLNASSNGLRPGSVWLIRDPDGKAWWHSLPDEEKEQVAFYAPGSGLTFAEAMRAAIDAALSTPGAAKT